MKIRLISFLALCAALTAAVLAQEANPAPSAGKAPVQEPGGDPLGLGWRGGGMGGRGVEGTVTAVASSYYTVKTETGESFRINFSANTRILKQAAPKQGERVEGPGGGDRSGRQRPAPEPIKATDIKTGDDVVAMGEVDTAAHSVGAVVVLQIDPERARMMREQRANYGKTWLMGKVTGINETAISLAGVLDNAAHTFEADENTTFRKRREPITLADIQVGDMVRVEGVLKNGNFMATSVSVMPQGGGPRGPHDGGPASVPLGNAPAAGAPPQ
jgi:hypothetical protein